MDKAYEPLLIRRFNYQFLVPRNCNSAALVYLTHGDIGHVLINRRIYVISLRQSGEKLWFPDLLDTQEEIFNTCIGYLQLLCLQGECAEWPRNFGDFILHAREHFRRIVFRKN